MDIAHSDNKGRVTISEMNFSTHAHNSLCRNGIRYLSDFRDQKITKRKLMRMRKVGKVTFNEIIDKLKEYDVELEEK